MNKIKDSINQIVIDELEDGNIPWRKTRNTMQVGYNQRPYSGINQLTLQIQKNKHQYWSNRWMTFAQIKNMGWSVLKWAKGTPVIFFKTIAKRNKQTDEEQTFPLLKMYFVFNLDQTTIDILEAPPSPTRVEEYLRAKDIVEIFTTWPRIITGDNPAYYPMEDIIRIPNPKDFESLDEYYHTLFHELIHATGHSSRLKRDIGKPTNHYEYGVEELVAEIGAAYLSAEAQIDTQIIDNSKAYIRGWLKQIKADKNLLFQASKQGRKASQYVLTNGVEHKKELLSQF